MNRLRVLVVLVVTVSLLTAVLFWSRRTASPAPRTTTPAACLDDYYESLRSGDLEKYRSCLGDPYRTRAEQRSFAAICREADGVKDLVQLPGPVEQESSAWVDVDEVRTGGVRRLRYHLRSADKGWVIVAIDPPRELAVPIPHGTPVGDQP